MSKYTEVFQMNAGQLGTIPNDQKEDSQCSLPVSNVVVSTAATRITYHGVPCTAPPSCSICEESRAMKHSKSHHQEGSQRYTKNDHRDRHL